MKKIIIGLAMVLVLIFLLVLLAPFLVDLNKYKDTILTQIRPYVPREVDFEHIELKILTGLGIELQGLTVSENPNFPREDFLSLEGLQIKVQVLPLLKKKIKVNKVVFRDPVVRLLRNAQGEFNFSDLAVAGGKGASQGPASPEEKSMQ